MVAGLSVGEIKRGLEANAERLRCAAIGGRTYWLSSASVDAPDQTSAFLLPNYDDYTVAYRERDVFYDRAANATGDPRMDVPFRHVLLVDGQVRGRWSAAPNLARCASSWSGRCRRRARKEQPSSARRTSTRNSLELRVRLLNPQQLNTPETHVKHRADSTPDSELAGSSELTHP